MESVQITVKNVDSEAFGELKAEAARKKINVGRALSLAIEHWLSSSRTPRRKLSEWKLISAGKDTRYLSEEIDAVLYGE